MPDALQKIKEFCLMDEVTQVKTQYEIKNLLGRSARLDIKAEDEDSRPMDVEIQNEDEGAEPKRTRYNSSLLDANTLKKGEDYDKLPENYVIFIAKNDVLKGNRLIYHMDRVIAETGQLILDEAHIIYVNASYHDDSPLGKLMQDFQCKNPDDMHYDLLADQTRYYKESEEGEKEMCRIMEELIENERMEDRKESALILLKMGKFSNVDIAEGLQLSIDVVNELEKELEAVPS